MHIFFDWPAAQRSVPGTLCLTDRTGLRPVWLVALIETPGPKSRPMVDEPSSLKPQASSLFWPSPFRESRGNRIIIVDWWTSYGVPTDIVDRDFQLP